MAVRYSLRQAEVFVAVASLGSFAAAAQQLNTSRTALASAVDALEAALGERLLHRKRSVGIQLTFAGQVFLAGALSLLKEAARLEHAVGSRKELTGELVLGATVSLASVIVPAVVARLAAAHPRLRVRVVMRGADELVALLGAGSLELLLSYATSTPLQPLEVLELFTSRFSVLVPRGRFPGVPGPVGVGALGGVPLAILDNVVSQQMLFSYLASAGVADVDLRYRVGALPLCIDLVRRGLAAAVIPFPPSQRRDLPGDVECFDLSPPPPPVTATLAWLRGVPPSLAAQAAIAEVRTLQQAGEWQDGPDEPPHPKAPTGGASHPRPPGP